MAVLTVTWEAEDGYCGGSRPHTIEVEVPDDEARGKNGDDFREHREVIDAVQLDFENNVSWGITEIHVELSEEEGEDDDE